MANRLSQIHTLSNTSNWHHINSKDNPADLLSRGLTPNNLIASSLWWQAPQWLHEDKCHWPKVITNCEGELPELKQKSVSVLTVSEYDEFPFKRFSSLARLRRVVAYCFRFISRCQRKPSEQGPLTAKELDKSLVCLTRISQKESFHNEIKVLQGGGNLNCTSKILSLFCPFDNDGILRVGGRLELSQFSYDKRHALLLSSKHYFTKLLFVEEHTQLCHAGPNLLLSVIRERFWPVAGRNLAKRVVFECIRCYKCKPDHVFPMMGILPKDRVRPTPPFYVTGIDYAGPLFIKTKVGRGAKLTKGYVSVFVCFSTKALHLELVSDLTTESFIAAFRRYVSRRGKPARVYSDNDCNLAGASRELAKFITKEKNDLSEKFHNEDIEWHFIPANAPHFGGLWEAGVKSMKFHLKRMLGNASLMFEQFATVLTQIEAIPNSRPLIPMTCAPNEFGALTPSHFLIGRTVVSLPDPDLRDIPVNRLSKLQHLQRLQQHFWERWSREYICELQNRVKWSQSKGNISEGALVLICDDNLPPLKRNLGRVVKVHPGADGLVRVATIKMKNTTVKRPVAELCPLPVES